MKISTIQLYDYRAFYAESEEDKKDYFIKVDGKNLLLYGENGSGKTSLFRGLKDIVHQNDFTAHLKTPLLNAGYVEIEFDDNSTDRFDATGTSATKSELLGIEKLNSFLSYKELLRVHVNYDQSDDAEINFFDLIVNNVLNEHHLSTLGPLKTAWTQLQSRNIIEETKVIQASIGEEISEEEAKEQIERLDADYISQITKFSDEFRALLKIINSDISKIISYFKQGVKITFELLPLTTANVASPELKANVEYANQQLPGFHAFLNEARLSAIAISIYLTALKSNPTQGAIKFLFLDDIFLGLDLSNRIPLLEILNDEFSDWQVFLTTYDRHWFEVAKQHLNDNWRTIEMYAVSIKGKNFDKPLLIPSDNHFAKSINYFKLGDYPASLNYLRKELEFQLKARLPEETVRHFDGKPHQLSYLWDLLVERYSLNNQAQLIPEKRKNELKTIRLSLLNPQSHDNLSAPVYKLELERAINLVTEIQSLPIVKGVTLLASGMELIYRHPKKPYSLTLELLQDWRIDVLGNNKTHVYPKCKIKHWQFDGNDYYNLKTNSPGTEPSTPMEDRFDRIRTKILDYDMLKPLTEDKFNANTSFEDIWTVKELIDRCDRQTRDGWFARIFRK